MTPIKVCTSLQALNAHAAFKLSSEEAQNRWQTAVNICSALVDVRVPNLRGKKDKFTADILTRCSWFITVKSGTTDLYGAQALKHMLQLCQKLQQANKKPEQHHIDCLRCYVWMIEEEDSAAVAGALAAFDAANGTAPAAGGGKASSSKASSSKAAQAVASGAASSKESVSLKNALRMFK